MTAYTEEQLSSCKYLDEAAKLVSNWKKFESFGWSRHNEEGIDNYFIYYTHTRDSKLVEESNHKSIVKMMEETKTMPFTNEEEGDYDIESHNHWGCGWIEGVVVRVYQDYSKRDKVTPAFAQIVDIINSLDEYPLLDEDDYIAMEHEQTIKNTIDNANCWMRRHDFDLKESLQKDNKWEGELTIWLWDNEPDEMENRDDNGGWPSDDAIEKGLKAINEVAK